MESGNPLLDDYVLGLTEAERPRVCFLPAGLRRRRPLHRALLPRLLRDRCEASHISLFRREQGPEDIRRHLLSQDLIYVGGGSVVSLLGVWKAHGIDEILREAWEAGVILCGLSAGSLCWFAEAVTGFHGAPQRLEGLGLLPFSNCVHYERESDRRESYHRFLREGMRAGLRRRGRRRAPLHRRRAEPGRLLASRGARLPARRLRAAGGGDEDRHHLPRRTRCRPGRAAARGARPPPARAAWMRRCAPHPHPRRPRLHLAPARPRRLRAAPAPGDRARRRAAADLHPADRQRRHLGADRPLLRRPSATAPASPPTSPSSASAGARWRSATTSSPRT